MASSSSGVSAKTQDTFFRGVRSDVRTRYKLLNHVGRGAYGEVWAAVNPERPNEKVAIKKITHVFSQVTEAKRILRELRILRHLAHPNIIRIRDCLHPQSDNSFADLWVCFDYVDLDLRKLIASPQNISIAHVQWITQQLLVALEYLHSAHVLHRDLKPANVLLSGTCDVKICDFGLARVVDEEDWVLNEQRRYAKTPLARQASSSSLPACPPVSRQMTTHVVTRWYRAPELILLQKYTTAIDVWSVGCILAELLTMLPEANLPPQERNALFPGRSCFPLSPDEDELSAPANLDQLNVIFSVIGTPTGSLNWIELTEMRDHLRGLSPVAPTPFADLLPGAPDNALTLLGQMLAFEPSRRRTVSESLTHDFFENAQLVAKRELALRPVDVATIDFENREVRLPQLRQLILGEILTYDATQQDAEAAAAAADGASGASSAAGGGTAGDTAGAEGAQAASRKRRADGGTTEALDAADQLAAEAPVQDDLGEPEGKRHHVADGATPSDVSKYLADTPSSEP